MEIPTRIQNVGLAVLCVLAVGASGFAFWSVNRPHPSILTEEAPGGASVATPTQDPSTTTSSPPPTSSSPATATPSEPPAGVSAWLDAWSGDADLLVVGDGFSNLPSQWVQLWADMVGNDRPVTIHHWGEAADVSFNDPIQLSDGSGDPLTVWSASRDGTTIHDAAEDYQRFVEASAPPDAVLVSMGLDTRNEDIAEGLDLLITQIDDEDENVPVLIAIGPDGLYEEGVGDALLSWAEEHSDRVSVVDLRDEAPDRASAEQWATAFQRALEES